MPVDDAPLVSVHDVPHIPLLEIETARLQLRQWRETDRRPFAELNADTRVMACFPQPLTRTQSDQMADRCEGLIEERGWGLWAAELKQTGAFIGFVGLHRPIPQLPCAPCTEIGWRLAFEHWGRGLATEAARAALEVGFMTLGYPEIVSFTALVNRRSRAVMERLGMQLQKETFEHPLVPRDSPLREHCLYQLARGQWQQQRH
ncbi:MAG: GNAT family N-acetyltransferase [Candidatus Thiodiazotropha sp.]